METYATLRPARPEDLPWLNSYAYQEGMDNMPGPEHVTVAVNADDVPVGFIRVLPSAFEEGVAFVNPVVTCATWRGFGVGRQLMARAFEGYHELRLVARGSSIPFYEHLGFGPISWDAIEPEVNENCDGCPLREECQPLPMGKYNKEG